MTTKIRIAEHPYTAYKLYGPYNFADKRKKVVLIPINGQGKRLCLTCARYLLSKKLGRVLNKNEETDHIDGDYTNDSIENIQVLDAIIHRDKTLVQKQTTHRIAILRCPHCGLVFRRRVCKTHLFATKLKSIISCSRSCATAFAHLRKAKPDSSKVKKGIAKNLIRIYYKQSRVSQVVGLTPTRPTRR